MKQFIPKKWVEITWKQQNIISLLLNLGNELVVALTVMLFSSSGQWHQLELVRNEILVVLTKYYLTKCVRLVMNRKVSCCCSLPVLLWHCSREHLRKYWNKKKKEKILWTLVPKPKKCRSKENRIMLQFRFLESHHFECAITL